MYKVLLADDEYPFVQSMIQYDWAAQNCILIGTALNGADALRKCRHLQPQILITDINMPIMNGIELIDEARKIIPDIQVILLTVYKEFDYAYKALHAGVIDYILKDMKIKENLGEAIEKAKQSYSHILSDNAAAGTTNPVIYLPSEECNDFEKRILSNHFYGPYDALLSVRMAKADLRLEITSDKIGVLLSENDLQIVLNHEGEFDLLFKEMNLNDVNIFISKLHKIIGDIRFIAACSFQIRDIDDYFIKSQENNLAINNAFYKAKFGLVLTDSTLKKPPKLTNTQMNEWLQKCTSCMNYDEVIAFVQKDIFVEANKMQYEPSLLRKLFEKILYRMEMKYDLQIDSAVVKEIKNAFSFNELCDSLIRGINSIFSHKNMHGKIVDDVVEYIERMIDSPSLQLTTVADAFGVSAGYLSKKLKDETGEGFQELLIRLRMEKAVHLLRDTNKKVYEIASECGYSNYRSFVKAFESIYHISPKRFK